MSRKTSALERGISLIELLVVVFIIGFISLVIFNLPVSIGSIGNSQRNSLAREIATKQQELARQRGYDNLANGTTAIVTSQLTKMPGGSGTLTIADCPITICQQHEVVKLVTVSLNWKDNQKVRNLTLTTLVAKGGL